MKRLLTICAVVGLMLSAMCVSQALANTVPIVNPPPEAPDWWNVECESFAYGYWEDDLTDGSTDVPPPDNADHWATNFLYGNTSFTASVVVDVVTIGLDNDYREDLYKEIFIYLEGTTTGSTDPIGELDTDAGVFSGDFGGSTEAGLWSYVVEGEIHPQPGYVTLVVTVPNLTKVTDIWAGENCLPEPATIALLGLGGLALIRRKRRA